MRTTIFALTAAALAASSAGALLHAAAAPAGRGLVVDITAPADHSRIKWQSQAPYAVTVSYGGKSTRFGEIPSSQVVLRAAPVANADAPPPVAALPDGVAEISRSNCTGCHDFSASSAGPSFAAMGKRYGGRAPAVGLVAGRIRNGSHGNWGSGVMPPHPEMTPAQANAIAQWIVSQAGNTSVQYAIGKSGTFRMAAPGKPGPHAGMALSAFYTGPLKAGDSRNGATGRNRIVVSGSGS